MINLCLVVIATQFSETKKRETERMLQERKRYQSTSTLASNSEPSSCYTEILKYIGHLYRRGKRKLVKLYYEKTGKHKKIKPERNLRKKKKGILHNQQHHHHCNHARSKNQRHPHYHYVYINHENLPLHRDSLQNHVAPRASPEASEVDPISSPRRPTFLTVPGLSAQASSESLNILALAAAEVLTPSLFKSYSPSPNQLSPHVSNANSRNPSFSVDGSAKHLQFLPDVVSTHSTKNPTIAASNTLVNDDYEAMKFHHMSEKGKYYLHIKIAAFLIYIIT